MNLYFLLSNKKRLYDTCSFYHFYTYDVKKIFALIPIALLNSSQAGKNQHFTHTTFNGFIVNIRNVAKGFEIVNTLHYLCTKKNATFL